MEHFLEVGLLHLTAWSLWHARPIYPDVGPFQTREVLTVELGILRLRSWVLLCASGLADEETVLIIRECVVNGKEDVFVQLTPVPFYEQALIHE